VARFAHHSAASTELYGLNPSLLTANNENVKVVQELLRHGSTKITLDIYAQAKMKDKRGAQQRIANRLHRPDQQVNPRKTSVPTKRRRLRRT